ncbi:MAG: hypothetical protein L3J16_07375 [Anaerolineales bacterium]|nr:hypothetical protein [Anaerolineales bacterium]
MQEIKDNIYIEDQYPGVTLAAINMPRGLIYLDAPPLPEHGRSWRADLLDLRSGPERMLVNLDAHVDRTLGARAMDCIVLAHEETASYFRNRPNTFKMQGKEIGAEWDSIAGIGNIRWAPPEITFTDRITMHWGPSPIIFEHHPGSAPSAIWAILPHEKVVFVGDAIVKNQPPFLETADIPVWIDALKTLLSDQYSGFSIVSGRGGVCANSTIQKQLNYLKTVHKKMERLAARKAAPEATERMIPSLLTPLRFLVSNKEKYIQRLQHGLAEYYLHHYIQAANPEDE